MPNGVPERHVAFLERFPTIGDAWDTLRDGEKDGPIDGRTVRLLKLAVAIGQGSSDSTHTGVRKAAAAGAPLEELEQVVAIAASMIGLPKAVKAHQWVLEQWDELDG